MIAGSNRDDPDRIVESITMSEALWALTHAHREILVETYFKGRTVAEAAQTLRIPLGTAKSRIFYALRALREALENEDWSMPTDPSHGDAGAYALGALEPASAAAFEAHLIGCDACADEVEALLPVVGLMGGSTRTRSSRHTT